MHQMHKIMEDNLMNQDVFTGQWKQMRGELKSWWGKLADDDFDRIGGQKDQLIGLVQEKYGYTRDQAQQELERRFKEYADKMRDRSSSGMLEANGGVAEMTAKAQELGMTAASVAGEAATAVVETMGSLASVIRRYPVQSLLVGVGLGYVLARMTKE
jgi:uncharacterized protein YjbJ (UPF0337 family)